MTTNRGQKQTGHTRVDERRRDDSRAAKRAQFTQPARRSRVVYAVAVVAVLAAVTGGAVLATRGGDAAPAAPAAKSVPVQGGTVSVPTADLASGEARFFGADVDGTTVRYFVVQDASGEVRTAFDACDVCYPAKKGYTQDGDAMVCNNCGRRFATKGIGTVAGGCNPSPLDATVADGEVLIGTDALAEGVRYFQ